jgi:hypothetical protein
MPSLQRWQQAIAVASYGKFPAFAAVTSPNIPWNHNSREGIKLYFNADFFVDLEVQRR